MKIAYLSFSCFPSREANSIQTIKMCSAFAKMGCDVSLYCVDEEKNFDTTSTIYDFYGVENNFEIVKIKLRNYPIRKDLLNSKLIFDEAKRRKPDLLYSRSLNTSYFTTFHNTPHLFESHVPPEESKTCLDYPSQVDLFKRIIKSKSLRKLIVISSALKYYYCEKYKCNSSIISVHPDSADEIISFDDRVELPGRKGTLKVGYVGQLYKGKGAEIIPDLAKNLPEYDFHIVGGNENEIIYFRRYIDNNLFVHGFVEPSITYKYLNSFDILLAPYHKDIFVSGGYNKYMSKYMSPLKLFEYMSARKPIIVSNLPVLREFLNEQNSILVEPGNVNEWILALKKMKSEELRNYCAYNAYILFKENYSWEKRVVNILSGINHD